MGGAMPMSLKDTKTSSPPYSRNQAQPDITALVSQ